MSNVDFKDNIICKYISLAIIWSLVFFFIVILILKIIFVSYCLNNLTNI
jgi:hypothetical protein